MSNGKISIKLFLPTIALMVALALSFAAGSNAAVDKIDWCHCEPNGNCQTLSLPLQALTQAGHVDANGNALHAEDHAGVCIVASPSPSPTPTPSPSVSPSPTPEITPTPTPAAFGMWMDDPGCGNSFGVNAKYTRDGNPVSGLSVEFKYMADHSYQVTNSDGVAEAGFEYKGNEKVYAIADGYPTQDLTPWLRTDCKPSENKDGGSVLGATTGGSVLGASTMAQTGTADEMMSIIFTLGAVLTTIGLKPYATKKN